MNQYGLEQVIHVLSNDNLELSCGLIEQEGADARRPCTRRGGHRPRGPVEEGAQGSAQPDAALRRPRPLGPDRRLAAGAAAAARAAAAEDAGLLRLRLHPLHHQQGAPALERHGGAAERRRRERQRGGGGRRPGAPGDPPPLCPFRQQAPPAAPEGAGSGLAANSAASALASALGVGTGGAAAGPAQQRWPEGQPQHSQHQPPPQSQQAQPPQQPQQPAKQPQPQQQAPRPRQPSAAPAARNQPATAQPETQAALSQLTAQADRAAHSLLADPPLLPPVDAASPDAYVPDGALDAGAALGLLPLDHPVPTLLRQLPERLAQLPQAGAAALHLARFAFQRLCGARMCPTRSQPPCAASLQHLR
ncbi:unnamed protein product, partial [Prorocentrum cordatum]